MSEPTRYVHLVDDAADLDGVHPVLLISLDGFLDAGNAAALAIADLIKDDSGRVVASFEVDAFFDYRARRPPMSFIEDHYANYEAPRLVVRHLTDARDTPYLLLHGPEPDTHWEAFAGAVRTVVEHFGVRLVVSLGSVPMAVPHTRPVMVTSHATRKELLLSTNIWAGELRIPASALAMLQIRLGEWGIDATGFVAHVPHYLAQFDHPVSSVKLLECVEVVTGLEWSLDGLHDAARVRDEEIVQQIADSEEVAAVVSGLEQQYDALTRGAAVGGLPLAEGKALPTAEELGAEFERFLAGLDADED